MFEKSLSISIETLGEDYLDTVISYANLAFVHMLQGKYGKAQELYEKSLRIRERMLGEEHPDTAVSYNNLAMMYVVQRECKKP